MSTKWRYYLVFQEKEDNIAKISSRYPAHNPSMI